MQNNNLTQMSAQTISAIVASWQLQAFTLQDMFKLWQSGELIDENLTFEDWQAQLQTETPALTVTPTPDKSTSALDAIRSKLGL